MHGHTATFSKLAPTPAVAGAIVAVLAATLWGAQPARAATDGVRDAHQSALYTEPADSPSVAVVVFRVDGDVDRGSLMVALDDQVLGADALETTLRVRPGNHRVRVEQKTSQGVPSLSEFQFLVGPGDKFEHTIVPSAVLFPAAARTRACYAVTPEPVPGGASLTTCAAIGLAITAMARRRKRTG